MVANFAFGEKPPIVVGLLHQINDDKERKFQREHVENIL
jgi:hypothetical protein